MPPNNTLWPLDPHTHGKHLVLEDYMKAWLPIMTRWNSKVLFIDGFAGPGKYAKGEDGSPVIALKALTNHSAKEQITNGIIYLFIENDKQRCNHLQQVIKEISHELPDNCRYYIENSAFNDALGKILHHVEERNGNLIPAFVMIDPFGVSGVPMKTIARILANPKSEIFFSFMYEPINRFKQHPNFEQHLDDLFGCPEWRSGIDISDVSEKKEFFFSLYRSQLKKSGAKHVLHFELYEGDRLKYAIFFGTQSLTGCDKMKQSIWKVAPLGDFKFRGDRLNQFMIDVNIADHKILANQLKNRFRSEGRIAIQDITDFVKSDATLFHSGHLKRKTLKTMEENEQIEVESARNKKFTYPDGTRIRFL